MGEPTAENLVSVLAWLWKNRVDLTITSDYRYDDEHDNLIQCWKLTAVKRLQPYTNSHIATITEPTLATALHHVVREVRSWHELTPLTQLGSDLAAAV